MTPKEIFEFACAIRLGLSETETNERVTQIIKRLNLEECQNSKIGDWMMRGISGGERKRASIGYELITEPSILLLDEPTSGLDSHSAKKVVQ